MVLFEFLAFVCISIGIAGKQDLPAAFRWGGTQLGRVVGFLQGAKARADRYTQQNEMKSLQNELRSGLRELDAVRAELMATFTRPMGRQLGSSVGSANRLGSGVGGAKGAAPVVPGIIPHHYSEHAPRIGDKVPTVATESRPLPPVAPQIPSAGAASTTPSIPKIAPSLSPVAPTAAAAAASPLSLLAPSSHTIGAIAEEEWAKEGINFKSRAETGSGLRSYDHSVAGSAVLSNLLQQSLVFDQYDRVIQKQHDLLQSKVDEIEQKVKQQSQQNQQQQSSHDESKPNDAPSPALKE